MTKTAYPENDANTLYINSNYEQPACILIMKNGSQYDINMSGTKLAKTLKDYND